MYTCVYCGTQSDGSGRSCPGCGAPIDVKLKVNNSGFGVIQTLGANAVIGERSGLLVGRFQF